MSGRRKLDTHELKLHQAALARPDKILSAKDAEKVVPDAAIRTSAVNFLLGSGLLKVLTNSDGAVSFRAVLKQEIEVKKDMSEEESMVLSHIQASGNEGIWTKHLKAKTELHQTVIDRCLKSLAQKQLVKSIKAVRHPTRKIYMLAHLEPSVELTGGPWYTDNELDTEFIKLLSTACLHYIRDRCFPKQRRSDDRSSNAQAIYAIGAAPAYPNARQIQHFLSESRITETQLSVEHVEMLLEVLILDGEVERLPAFGIASWDSTVIEDEEDSEDDPPRKRRGQSDADGRKNKRLRNDVDTDGDGDGVSSSQKKSKKRKRSTIGEESDDEEKASSSKKKKKGQISDISSDKLDDSDDDIALRARKRRNKLKNKRSAESGSDTDADSSDLDPSGRSISKSKRMSTKHSSSPGHDFTEIGSSSGAHDQYGAFVYRAIRQERVALGWSQAPCGRCPVFDFCKNSGPTNPKDCAYYENWLHNAAVTIE